MSSCHLLYFDCDLALTRFLTFTLINLQNNKKSCVVFWTSALWLPHPPFAWVSVSSVLKFHVDPHHGKGRLWSENNTREWRADEEKQLSRCTVTSSRRDFLFIAFELRNRRSPPSLTSPPETVIGADRLTNPSSVSSPWILPSKFASICSDAMEKVFFIHAISSSTSA